MRWKVTGVSLQTGTERSVLLEADDEKQAAIAAKGQGIMATSATQVGPSAPAEAPPLNYARTGPPATRTLEVKRLAPVAYLAGGLLGALWPFGTVYVVSWFSTGANVFELGEPGNWADWVLAFCVMASFGGPITLAVLILLMIAGYKYAAYLHASFWIWLRSRHSLDPADRDSSG